jgi:hypothetical protein
MERLLQDVRYGTRSILKSTRFTVAAVPTLALGTNTRFALRAQLPANVENADGLFIIALQVP